jgi:hypothetical protein
LARLLIESHWEDIFSKNLPFMVNDHESIATLPTHPNDPFGSGTDILQLSSADYNRKIAVLLNIKSDLVNSVEACYRSKKARNYQMKPHPFSKSLKGNEEPSTSSRAFPKPKCFQSLLTDTNDFSR